VHRAAARHFLRALLIGVLAIEQHGDVIDESVAPRQRRHVGQARGARGE
jgi:hypothetical protein